MSFTNKTSWCWVGKSRRNTLTFHHNTFSGVQQLWLNGEELFKTSWRFKLTGSIMIPVENSSVEIYMVCDEWGNLVYRMTVDAKLIAPEGTEDGGSSSPDGKRARGGIGGISISPGGAKSEDSVWRVSVQGRVCEVEFHHRTQDILVDGVKMDVEGEFVEEDEFEEVPHPGAKVSGVRYPILLPPNTEALLTVIPGERPALPPITVLSVSGVIQERAKHV